MNNHELISELMDCFLINDKSIDHALIITERIKRAVIHRAFAEEVFNLERLFTFSQQRTDRYVKDYRDALEHLIKVRSSLTGVKYEAKMFVNRVQKRTGYAFIVEGSLLNDLQ